MLYRLILVFLFLTFPFQANAERYLVPVNEIKDQLKKKEDILNLRISQCEILLDRELETSDKWFLSLSDQQKNFVLHTLFRHTLRNCSINEEKNYVFALVEFAARTGDRSALDEWLKLREYDRPDVIEIDVIKQLDQDKLNHFYTLPESQFPFDLIRSVEKYHSDK